MSLKAHSTLCKDSRITVNCLSTFQRHMACTTRTQGKPLEGLAIVRVQTSCTKHVMRAPLDTACHEDSTDMSNCLGIAQPCTV